MKKGDRVKIGDDLGTVDEVDERFAVIVWDISGCTSVEPVNLLEVVDDHN